MDDRPANLAAAVERLTNAVAGLEQRVSVIERALHLTTDVPDPSVDRSARQAESPAGGVSLLSSLTLIGRSFVAVGGAFLLRALTDTGTLPPTMGALLGFFYGVLWLALASRAATSGNRLSATFHAFTAVLIIYPLLWEANRKLGLLSPEGAAAIVAVLALIIYAVAWRGRLRAVAWAVTLATSFIGIGLMMATGAMEAYVALFLVVGAITVWLAYGRHWHLMRWPAALLANLVVLQMCILATDPPDPDRRFGELSVPIVLALSVGLVVVYLGSFAIRNLARRRDVTLFEALQSAGALLIGFGGAATVARAQGSGALPLGLSALLAAAACYAVAFAFVRRRQGRGRNFFFYSTLALVLTFLGSSLVLHGAALAVGWATLAIVTAVIGGHYDRVTLRGHSAAYATAAAVQGGLIHMVVAAFAAPVSGVWTSPAPSVLLILGMVAVCYAILVLTQRGRAVPARRRIPRFVVSILTVLGVGALVVTTVVRIAAGDAVPNPAQVAVARTVVLSVGVIVVAAVGRQTWLVELSWLAYPLLVVAGIKVLMEDIRVGGAGVLFGGFLSYGVALIAAARLRRSARAPGRDDPDPPSSPGS